MKLRYTNAIMSGTLSFLAAMAAGWIWTDLEFLEMTFLALLVYYAGIAISLWLTRPKKEPKRTRWKLQIYDLRKEGWDAEHNIRRAYTSEATKEANLGAEKDHPQRRP